MKRLAVSELCLVCNIAAAWGHQLEGTVQQDDLHWRCFSGGETKGQEGNSASAPQRTHLLPWPS